ncbi:hypothetical protein BX666DRAFT_1985837 [Dichotomocladium elegans]|nr:hypothetical protein BX666DRAFT_1985837 [Dichotomocladium elegans]
MAIRTLAYGLKVSSNPTPRVMREMLLKSWIDGRSALDWAIANDCQVFLSDKKVLALMDEAWKYGGPAYTDWVDVPNHPCHVWQHLFYHRQHWLHVITNYLARWAAPRYQALVALFCGLIYLGLHLATLANADYQGEYPRPHEYAYYFLVVSDVLLSLSTLRKPSTLFSLGVVFLLVASMILRLVAFVADDLAAQATYIFWSFVLLAWATPLMIFRVALWMGDLSWHVAKVRYVVDRAMRDAFWVLVIGAIALLAFWISLGALWRGENVSVLALLRYLALGALHTPVIGDTIQWMPWAAGVMLFAYLAIMLLVIGTLLTASMITTVLLLWPAMPHIRQTFFAQRAARRSGFGVFLPTVAIELVISLVGLLLTGVFRMKNDSRVLRWLELVRQVLWFMVYLPVILVVALVEAVVVLAKKVF